MKMEGVELENLKEEIEEDNKEEIWEDLKVEIWEVEVAHMDNKESIDKGNKISTQVYYIYNIYNN